MTRPGDARAGDLLARDHYPTCPRCGNLCGLLAQVCADCGCRLRASEVDLADARAVGSRAMDAAKREAVEADRERGS